MTAREKLAMEHPNDINNRFCGGCRGCPDNYGYLKRPAGCTFDRIGSEEKCSDCWDREIPEEKGCSNCFHKGEEDTCNRCVGGSNYYPTSPSMAAYIDGKKVAEAINKGIEDGLNAPRILDSGNRTEFETGAVRDIQEGKGRCDLMPLDVVAAIYTAFFPEEPEMGIIFGHIAAFQESGDVSNLYWALDNFERYKSYADMLLEVAKHFEEGCKKYGENNWKKGIPVKRYIDSAVRHYLKFLRGDKDEPHDRAFCWNIMCAIWTCKHKPELDDYEKAEKENAC